ncbi:hypothetical protein RUM43_003373 [Polyplax serrata]|uniref:Uncharacterized protein n=1 Tax=Polyplax serrata TaxID=468196 RepID=A0AAN8S9D7_POLSC
MANLNLWVLLTVFGLSQAAPADFRDLASTNNKYGLKTRMKWCVRRAVGRREAERARSTTAMTRKLLERSNKAKTKKVELEMTKRNTKLAIMGTAKEEGPGQVAFRWETVEE